MSRSSPNKIRSAAAQLYVSCLSGLARRDQRGRSEPGFEVAQSMGIALLGLVVAAAFAELLTGFGQEIIEGIRAEIGLGG